jgi:hypothetical protein
MITTINFQNGEHQAKILDCNDYNLDYVVCAYTVIQVGIKIKTIY